MHIRSKINLSGIFLLFLAFISFSYLAMSKDSNGEVLLISVIFMLALISGMAIWRLSLYESGVPIYNIGAVLILVTALYSIYPLFAFWMSDFEWTLISDGRLRLYRVTARELALFALYNVYYMLGLVVSYLFFIKKHFYLATHKRSVIVDKKDIYAAVIAFSIISSWLFIYNNNMSSSYLLVQVTGALSHSINAITIGVLYIAVVNWDKKIWKYTGLLILVYHLTFVLIQYHGRTYLVVPLIAFIMLYHRFVKPISFKSSFVIFIALLVSFILWGFVRVNMLGGIAEYSVWSGTNEFTSLLGTAYDLYMRKEVLGTLGDIPSTIFINDFILLIPSQLLPFYKWGVSQWYLEVIGLRGTGVGMGFGVLSQIVVGGGDTEALLRGGILGGGVAMFHNWYIKRSHLLYANIAYVYIAIQSYHTYRAQTGYIVYELLYRLMPALLIFFMIKKIMLIRDRSIS